MARQSSPKYKRYSQYLLPINAALAGGRLDAGAGTMTVAGLSGNGVLSASAGTMHFQDAFTVGELSLIHIYNRLTQLSLGEHRDLSHAPLHGAEEPLSLIHI